MNQGITKPLFCQEQRNILLRLVLDEVIVMITLCPKKRSKSQCREMEEYKMICKLTLKSYENISKFVPIANDSCHPTSQ